MQTIALEEASAALRRILFILELPADRNEVQEIDLGNISTGDSFTLGFDGQTTAAINYAADMASAIDTALENLSNIAASDITVVKGTGQVYEVTFGGTLAAQDVALMTITPTGFTEGGITELAHGGVAGAPARGLTIATDEVLVSKNGGAAVESTGTVAEIGDGRYYYEASASDVATAGFLSLAIVRDDVAVTYPTAQVVPTSSTLGSPVIRSCEAQAGSASAVTLDTEASATSDYYVPSLCYIRTGTGAGQARLAYAYDGATKILSVEPGWATEPDNTSVVDLLPIPPPMVDLFRANHDTFNTFGEVSSPEDIRDAILLDGTPFNGADVADILTAAETGADLLDLTDGVETDLTVRQALRLIVAMAAGKLTGGGTTTVTIRNPGDSKNRIVATVDTSGNRSAITTDLT